MGTFGIGPFENDDASDFVYELEEAADLQSLASRLEPAFSTEYFEAPDCQVIIAFVEAIAACVGSPVEGIPDEVTAWVTQHASTPSQELRDRARLAVEAVRDREDSELRQLWEEAEEEYPAWRATLDDLITRLN